jgi:hypothetical protein
MQFSDSSGCEANDLLYLLSAPLSIAQSCIYLHFYVVLRLERVLQGSIRILKLTSTYRRSGIFVLEVFILLIDPN